MKLFKSLIVTAVTAITMAVAAPGVSKDTLAASEESVFKYNDVTKYTYEITPLLAPFNDYFYVKTDNPDPSCIRFVDKESKYYTADDLAEEAPSAIRYLSKLAADVEYENESTFRVKGGYIFVRDTGSNMDGGELVLQQASVPYEVTYYSWGSSYNTPKYTDTNITVKCASVMPAEQYLIQNYTSKDKSLMENMQAVQDVLEDISLYPKRILDTSRPRKDTKYPSLYVSPYFELGLEPDYNIYEQYAGTLLTKVINPFVIDSLGFPNMLRRVAKILEPNCTITSGGAHPYIRVTFNGVTQQFGGAGGSKTYEDTLVCTDSIYTKYIEKTFKFDGSSSDYAKNCTYDMVFDKYKEYSAKSTVDMAPLKDLITGETYKKTITKGTWVKVLDGYSINQIFYGYVYPNSYGSVSSLQNAWVDGRYICILDRFEPGVKFGDVVKLGGIQLDTSKAGIVIRNMTFTDCYGNVKTQDVLYSYDSDNDNWAAMFSYYPNGYLVGASVPELFILTRAQVEKMVADGKIDGNTNTFPESGLNYSGWVAPGTPFTAVRDIKLNMSKLDMAVGNKFQLKATITPASATEQNLIYESSDTSIATVDENGMVTAVKPGKVTITCWNSESTNVKSTCEINVVNGKIVKNADGYTRYYVDNVYKIDFTGFVVYNNAIYRIVNGKPSTTDGLIYGGVDKVWYYVKNGKIDYSYSGLVYYTPNKTWYYVRSGMIDFNYTGLVYNSANKTWYYVRFGKIDFNYTGLVYNTPNGLWYYVQNGRMTLNYTGYVKHTNGITYYVKDSRLVK